MKILGSIFKTKAPVIPVIPLNGIILASSGGMRRGGLNLQMLSRLLDQAFTMRRAKAVALLINSPGGSPVQSAMIASRIRELSRKNDLPVISFVEDIAASGGYWLACAGDQIIAHGASIIGSIGVVSSGFGFDRAIEKLGIDRRLYTAGNQKAMLDPFQAENADDVAHLRALQDDIHSQFIALVKSRRGSRLKGADSDIFSGAFWTGQKALELGLVDRIGEIRPVLEEQFGDKVQLRLLSARKSMFGFRTNQPGVDAISTDASAQIIDTLMLKLEERLEKMRYGL